MDRPKAPALSLDNLLQAADNALRALFAPAPAPRTTPELPDPSPLAEPDRRHVAGLMRVNHAGEIAAQALYHGQALMARSPQTREFLLRAAAEEGDHLAWCERRLTELGARPSLLNPFWYAGSFAIGATAAALSDRLSLGFVAETERQVEGHLADHLERLPDADLRSRRIIEAMQRDELAHAQAARSRGAGDLPPLVQTGMKLTSKVMTRLAYWI
ncbi:MAG: 2-polyprenyl-3-methyl-6-methoxy-1,4-benzoquinone monooxygenase [Gammaproteobacteria bacterium]|nr:2-polyprenyl-3-methyl-6-methoxy-1,4-benzoquinone monooxygenase [Gammaproteobacteria bacterium]MDE2250486.1 2-polyprenyl-3-methyl-6-methoxy-1,4-benzoquinone monooxygenase [Gammaproteobacteria bacterium]